MVLAASLVATPDTGAQAGRTSGASAVRPPFVDAAASAATAPADASAVAAEAPAPTPHGPDERQLCGGAWVRAADDVTLMGIAPVDPAREAALRDRTIARLRARRDEYARVVGLWLAGGDPAPLVEAALATRDPKVYALAFQSCQRPGETSTACASLSAAQWARLDPGNAAPWLDLLEEAAARRDVPGIEESLFQIGHAERNERRYFAPMIPVLDSVPDDDASLLDILSLIQQPLAVSTAAFHGLAPLTRICRGDALADANRRQACAAAADVLVDRSDSLLDMRMGAAVVANLTGSTVRGDVVRAAFDGWLKTAEIDLFDCGSVRRGLARLRGQAVVGEAGQLRRWIEQSGLTSAQLLERNRESERRRDAAASAPAAAASMPEPESAASGPTSTASPRGST